MEQDRVSSLLHRHQVRGGCPRRQHNLAVGVEQCQKDEGEVDAVEGTVLVVDGAVTEEQRVVAENGRLEEGGGLFGQAYEEVGEGGRSTQDQNDPRQPEGALDGAHVTIVQGEADGDVTLDGHAGKDEGGGARG